jgi:hypothetical protein
MRKQKKNGAKAHLLKSNSKWFVANNTVQKNKDITILLPVVKFWYSQYYFLETGVLTPAFGVAISFLKWNYYFTIQKGY